MDADDTVFAPYENEELNSKQSIGILVVGGNEFVIKQGSALKVGRQAGKSDVFFPVKTVSREHAILEADEGGHFITDCNSICGTFRGKMRLRPGRTYELTNDTVLHFGPDTVATYKIVEASEDSTSFLKQKQQVRANMEIQSHPPSIDISSPPTEFHMTTGEHDKTEVEDPPLYLEPTQSDGQAVASATEAGDSSINRDPSNAEDFASPKLVIACGESEVAHVDTTDDQVATALDDMEDTVADTVSTCSDADLQMVIAADDIEKNEQEDSKEVEKDFNQLQEKTKSVKPLFSQPPTGADSTSLPSSVHWQSADIVSSTADIAAATSALTVNDEDTRDTEIAEDVEVGVEPEQKTSLAKPKRPPSRRKTKAVEAVEQDGVVQAVPIRKPTRKSKVALEGAANNTPPPDAANMPLLVSPPTAAAATALLDLKKSAEKDHTALLPSKSKATSRKSTRRGADSKKLNETNLGSSIDEETKPSNKMKRAKTFEEDDAPVDTKTRNEFIVPETPTVITKDVDAETSSKSVISTVKPTPSRKVTARRSAIAARDAKILITGEKDDATVGMINQLGANTADDLSNCTHLIVGGLARRTVKLVACIGHGIPIASVEWLKASVAAKHLLEPDDFRPEGIETLESSQNFSIAQTLEMARKKRLLDGYSVYAMPKLSKLKDDEIKAMVKSAGGRFLTRRPKSFSENTVVIVGDGMIPAGSDQQAAATVNVPPDVSEFASLGLPMVSTEFLLAGILRYDADPSHFPVEIPVSYNSAANNVCEETPAAVKGKSRRPTMAVSMDENSNKTQTAQQAEEKKRPKTTSKKSLKQKTCDK